jgi:hypothetical protein
MAGTLEPLGGSPDQAAQVRAAGRESADTGMISQDEQVAVLKPGERVHLEVREPTQGKQPRRPLFEFGYCESDASRNSRERTGTGHGVSCKNEEIAA